MESTLKIDKVLRGYFTDQISTYRKYDEMNRYLRHYGFQDTECDNNTECYFYFTKSTPPEKIREFGELIHKCLGVDSDYEWMVEDQTYDGNPEIRLEVICSVKF